MPAIFPQTVYQALGIIQNSDSTNWVLIATGADNGTIINQLSYSSDDNVVKKLDLAIYDGSNYHIIGQYSDAGSPIYGVNLLDPIVMPWLGATEYPYISIIKNRFLYARVSVAVTAAKFIHIQAAGFNY